MWQIILTGIAVSAAVIVAILFIVRGFRRKKRSDPCAGCNTDCAQCALHNEIIKRKKKR